jgi:membrane protein
MLKKLILFTKDLNEEIKKDRGTGLAAEQAYYYLLSLFPLLVFMLSLLPYLNINPQEAIDFLKAFLPSESVSVVEDNITQLLSDQNGGLLTFGIIGTLWSASNGLNAFIRAINTAFDVEETRNFIKVRGISLFLTICLVFALAVILIFPVFGRVILDMITSYVPLPGNIETLILGLRWVAAVAVIIIVMAFMFKMAPNKHYPFKQLLPGAAAATIIWIIASFGFSFYVSNFGNYSSSYGSLGGVIILMLWLYITGLALVIGGEINALLHKRYLKKEEQANKPSKPVPKTMNSDNRRFST